MDISPAFIYRPLALSSSWSNGSHTMFILWQQRRYSDLVVSVPNGRKPSGNKASTQSKASSLEPSDSSLDNNTGSQDPPSGDEGSLQSPPSGGQKSKCQSYPPQLEQQKQRHPHSTPSESDTHSSGRRSPPSGGDNIRPRKRRTSQSHQYTCPHSTSSESDVSLPQHKHH